MLQGLSLTYSTVHPYMGVNNRNYEAWVAVGIAMTF